MSSKYGLKDASHHAKIISGQSISSPLDRKTNNVGAFEIKAIDFARTQRHVPISQTPVSCFFYSVDFIQFTSSSNGNISISIIFLIISKIYINYRELLLESTCHKSTDFCHVMSCQSTNYASLTPAYS